MASAVIVPPVHTEAANKAVAELGGNIAQVLEDLGAVLSRRTSYEVLNEIYWRARGSYAVSWGDRTRPWTTTPTSRGAFGWTNDNPATPQATKFRDFTDGLSNCLLMSEVLLPRIDATWDGRGDFLNDDGNFANFQFMTINTPNSGVDVNQCVASGDPAMPCVAGAQRHDAARSRHVGGVHTLIGDGTVRFVSDNIDLATWRGLSTIDGSEVVGDY